MHIHLDFALNGRPLNYTGLMAQVEAWSNGDPYKKAIASFLSDWFNASDEVVVHTSGSTGKPKPIHLQKAHMKASARATASFFGTFAGTKALLCLSADYIAGKMMWVRALELGWDLHIVPPSNGLTEINSAFDFVAMVPMQVQANLNLIDHFKTLIVGGAPMSEDLKNAVRPKKVSVFETYGMTETITHIALKSVTGKEKCFRALSGVSFSLDSRGCLVIDAPNIANEKIVTNDLVRLGSPTTFEWLGRADNVINSGGVKLIPEQIEKVISPYVSYRFFLSGMPHPSLGEQLVLMVETKAAPVEIEEMLAQISWPHVYWRPKQLFCTPRFIETPSGKIDRNRSKKALGL
ncbi:AMP-binding protein [Sediminicola luteus]|nr:AMP-binding protein [Sediminicola luteus]